jgi:hypothetical protein
MPRIGGIGPERMSMSNRLVFSTLQPPDRANPRHRAEGQVWAEGGPSLSPLNNGVVPGRHNGERRTAPRTVQCRPDHFCANL